MAHRLRLARPVCLFLAAAAVCGAQAKSRFTVPDAPPADAKPQTFKDGHFGVRFEVPQGWQMTRRDGEVGTFHLDARTASPKAEMRGVLAIEFNPYPYSTFSGARFYYSAEPHSSDQECAAQATGPEPKPQTRPDLQDIDGMSFAHGHEEEGKICIEARDEVYTAFRKGSCYRFDLAMNTFCSVSSGAIDLTDLQVEQIDQRMTDILSTVKLAWTKTGPHPVPAPKVPPALEPLSPDQHHAVTAVRTGY